MTDGQRTIPFWVLIVLAPLTFFYVATEVRGDTLFAAGIAFVVCLGAAFYVRAGRSTKPPAE